MPIRRYEPLPSPCRLCGHGFEVMQAAGEAALTTCPRCGGPVRCATAVAVNTPRLLKPLAPSEAKASGFAVYKRTGAGEFEKL